MEGLDILSMLDLLAKVKASLNDYEPEAGDICRLEAFEYTASGVETAYAVHSTVERGGTEIYNRTQWTDKYELVEPIALVKLARNAIVSSLASPANFWVTDSAGKNAGLDPQTGALAFEFQMGITPLGQEHARIVIPEYDDGGFQIGVVGTGQGIYNLLASAIDQAGHVSSTFSAVDIPTGPGFTHQYAVDWPAVSRGEKGVTLQIDTNGDGVFEQSIMGGPTLRWPIVIDQYVQATVARAALDPKTGLFSVNVTVKNKSSTVIGSPLWFVIESISNPGLTVANASGTTTDGKPYLDLSGLLGDGKLDPGEAVSTRVYFNNPKRLSFTFKSSVRGVISP
jgi:hypothetical protein